MYYTAEEYRQASYSKSRHVCSIQYCSLEEVIELGGDIDCGCFDPE
jgi:hypothetical protein